MARTAPSRTPARRDDPELASGQLASGRRVPQQDRSLRTVERLLGAAAQVFLEAGYEGATTNRVAEAAGLSVGSLYQFFPNKASLLGALQQRWTARLGAELDAALSDAAPGAGQRTLPALVDAVLDVHARLHAESRGLLGFLLLRGHGGSAGSEVRHAVQERLERLDARMRPAGSAPERRLRAQMCIHLADALYTLDPSGAGNEQVRAEVRAALLGYLVAAS